MRVCSFFVLVRERFFFFYDNKVRFIIIPARMDSYTGRTRGGRTSDSKIIEKVCAGNSGFLLFLLFTIESRKILRT